MSFKRGVLVGILLFFLYFAFRYWQIEEYFKKKGRLNLVFYGSRTYLLSLDLDTQLNYYAPLPLDVKTIVPGGYGKYRIGSIGKLAYLEKKPELLRRSFSLLFGTAVDYYFYTDLKKVYYEDKKKQKSSILPNFFNILTSSSNASLIEKVYLFVKLTGSNPSSFSKLILNKGVVGSDLNLDRFHNSLQGFFYSSLLRKEDKSVEIFFSKYFSSADNISSILEGMGIRVIDYRKKKSDRCIIEEQGEKGFSARLLTNFFGCKYVHLKGEGKVIKFYLGDIEKLWR